MGTKGPTKALKKKFDMLPGKESKRTKDARSELQCKKYPKDDG